MLPSLLTLGTWLLSSFFILPTGSALDRVCPLFVSEHERFGVNTTPYYGSEITEYDIDTLNLAWYLDYMHRPEAPRIEGKAFLPLLPSRHFHPATRPLDLEYIAQAIEAHPGAIWILGNEPDRVNYQDNQLPEMFAVFYHEAYRAIKQRDPAAQIAIGGLVQPTPIRLRYLDQVLEAYQHRYGHRLPVDIWTVHNFILREELHNWGADIPPGLEEYAHEGIKYGIADHGNLDTFKQQLIAFRRWMAGRGYRDKPLLLTEYGILFPEEFGFPDALIQEFMLDTFDFMHTARDAEIGYPFDDNRLVQAWSWYSLNDRKYDPGTGRGSNGSLFDHDSTQLTRLGEAFGRYTAPLVERYRDPAVAGIHIAPAPLLPIHAASEVEVQVWVVNAGNQPAQDIQVSLWQEETMPEPAPAAIRQTVAQENSKIGEQTINSIATHCAEVVRLTFSWSLDALEPGTYTLRAEAHAAGDPNPANSLATLSVHILPPGTTVHTLYIPQAGRPWLP